jgi:hypothetical protein
MIGNKSTKMSGTIKGVRLEYHLPTDANPNAELVTSCVEGTAEYP